jgi:ribonuclease HepT-like protein
MNAQRFLLLRADIDRELRQLGEVVREGREALAWVDPSPGRLELRGVGSVLHDFYSGIERVLERIALALDGELPTGHDWHARLLERMATDVESVRPRVLSEEVAESLRPYLRLRHLFRNIYGAELRWDRCRSLVSGMEAVWTQFAGQMEVFREVLKELHDGCR